MKKAILILTILVTTFISACKKQGVSGDTYITALKNNVSHSFKTFPAATFQDSLDIFGVGSEESMYIRIKFNGVGKYLLNGKQASYTTTIGQDVRLSNYALDPSNVSTFIITDYNASEQIILGTFNIFMIRTYGNPETDYPKNLNFSEGKFRVKLVK